jgi:6-pyruvoyltetrahydropterin/6-carboxytetrahydropterin synthase
VSKLTPFKLTREIRFGIDVWNDQVVDTKNGHAGRPALTGLGHYFEMQVTLLGELDVRSSYLRNIKEIDDQVRKLAVPMIRGAIVEKTFGGGGVIVHQIFQRLQHAWPGATLHDLKLNLSPFLAWSVQEQDEKIMVKLSQKFEFSAAHRLHNASENAADNIKLFGKCNNPLGHGHNYEVQVTIAGTPDARGVLLPVGQFEQRVEQFAIDAFDHKHLNHEVSEFTGDAGLNPSVENIAMVIYNRLKPAFGDVKLDSVTVWETPKTWCEYRE